MRIFMICLLICAQASAQAETQPGEAALTAAISAGDLHKVMQVLDTGFDLNAAVSPMELTPLARAAALGDVPIVQALLDAGADPDMASLRGANALSVAVRSCKAGEDVIAMLIGAGADLENRSGNGLTPLLIAVGEKRRDMAMQLIAAGADVNALTPFGDGVLNFAIYVKDPVLVNAALEHGVQTVQLSRLFRTVEYDPPGWHDVKGHQEVLCGQ
jgi:uncharacterized protein